MIDPLLRCSADWGGTRGSFHVDNPRPRSCGDTGFPFADTRRGPRRFGPTFAVPQCQPENFRRLASWIRRKSLLARELRSWLSICPVKLRCRKLRPSNSSAR